MGPDIEHRLVAGVYDPVVALADRTYLAPHRAYLVADLSGRVLDLGAGTGRMVPYLKAHLADDTHATVHAVEPDPHMRKRAVRAAHEHRLSVRFVGARAERLPYRSDTFDVVLAVMVFCTIDHPVRALEEACRVIRPGGELRVLEHVVADGWRGRLQRTIQPIWRRVAGGCRPDRATDRFLDEHHRLEPIEVDRLQVGITPIRPFVRGRFRVVG